LLPIRRTIALRRCGAPIIDFRDAFVGSPAGPVARKLQIAASPAALLCQMAQD
jgi:hypothetical protein